MRSAIPNNGQACSRLGWAWVALELILSCGAGGAAENRVLELDGQNSFVELPSNIFNELEEATVEGWIKFKEFRTESRFFDFGSMGPGMYVTEVHATPSIRLTIDRGDSGPQLVIEVANALRLDQWCHVAAVTGPAGMKLYLDGVLLGTNAYSGSFQAIQNGDHNYLGRNNWKGYFRAEDFRGQMDEIRVWRMARTQEQIQENLFQQLTGSEEGLVGLWNFDDGTAQDSSPRRHHGRLAGKARCVPEVLPSPQELLRPMLLHGKVTDETIKPLPGATLVLEQENTRIAEVSADRDGEYRMAVYPSRETFDVSATSGAKGDWKLNLRLRPGEWQGVNFVLKDASLLSGRVDTLDAQMRQGRIVVQALRAGSTNSTGLAQENSAPVADTQWTDDDSGRFAFLNLKPGRYQIRCHGNGRFIYFEQGKHIEIESGKALPEIRFNFPPLKKGRWKSYTLIDGLPIDDVHDLLFDREGVLWLATWGGVVRFDGSRWTRFTKEDGLTDNRVNAIAEDRKGELWFATENGVARYADQRWNRFQAADGLADNRVRALLGAPDGSMWLATAGGVSQFDGKNWKTIDQTKGLPDDDVSSLCRDAVGALWIGTREGVCRYDGKTFRNFTTNDGLADNGVSAIHSDAGGVLWFGTARGLTRFDGRTFAAFTSKDGLPPGLVRSIHRDAKGALWIAADSRAGTVEGGLTRWDERTFVRYGKADGLTGEGVRSIRQAPDGTMWFATEAGVSRFHETSLANFTTQDGLPNNDVSRLQIFSDGTIWFWRVNQGADEFHWPENDPGDGICRYDGNSFATFNSAKGLAGNRVSAIFRDPSGGVWLTGQGGVSRYENQSCNKIIEGGEWGGDGGISIDGDRDATLWFGRHNGVSRYDGSNLENFSGKNVLENKHVSAVHRDAGGMLWFGTLNEGLWRYDGERFLNFSTNQGLPSPSIRSIHPAPDGKFWLRTGLGIARFDGRQFTAFTSANGLSEDKVNALHVDPEGTIWVGTASSGVTRYRDGAFTTFAATRNRLAHDKINAIYRDAEGVLWFGTDGGVSQFNGIGWSSLDERDGLAGNRVKAIAQDATGVFWFATNKGLTRYERNKVRPNPPVVTLETGEEPDRNSIPTVTTGRRVTLDFHVVDFNNRSQNQRFRCQIQRGAASIPGQLGENWLPPEAETRLEWSTNKPGLYTFAVQYIDRDLRLSEPTMVALKVVPPWYLNAWIAIPTGAGLLALLSTSLFAGWRYLVHRREAGRLREQMYQQEHQAREALEQSNRSLEEAKEASEAASRAKSTFLANMSHEIRTPMNAILGFSDLLNGVVKEPKERSYVAAISSSGKSLLTIINDILDLSKIEAGRLELHYEPVSVRQLLREVVQVFSQKAEEKGLKLEINVAEELPDGLLLDEVRLRQILFNVIGNAVKFTDQGTIRISAASKTRDADESQVDLLMHVADSGIGIPAGELDRIFDAFTQVSGQSTRKYGGTGLGLAITKRLTGMLGGTLRVESEVGVGSTFHFEFRGVAIAASSSLIPPCGHPSVGLERFQPSTILVVEDHPLNRRLLAAYFEKTKHRLLMAANGREGVEQARNEKLDLILMDIRMPEMDGWEAARILKNDERLKSIPIIAITASPLADQDSRTRELFDAFLRKPVSQADLVEVVALFLPRAPTPQEPLPIANEIEASPARPSGKERPGSTELIALLEVQLKEVWPGLCERPNIAQIEKFALRLAGWAETYQAEELRRFAEGLHQQAERFDVERLAQTLRQFPEIARSPASADDNR